MSSGTVVAMMILVLTGISFGVSPCWFPISSGMHWEYDISGTIIFGERIYSVRGERTVSVTEVVQYRDGCPIYQVEKHTVLSGIPTPSGEDLANTEVLFYHVKQDSILIYNSLGFESICGVIVCSGIDTGISSWVCSNKSEYHSSSIRYLPYPRSMLLPYGIIDSPVSILTETFSNEETLTSSSVEYFGLHTGPVLIYEDTYRTGDSDFQMQLISRLRNKYKD